MFDSNIIRFRKRKSFKDNLYVRTACLFLFCIMLSVSAFAQPEDDYRIAVRKFVNNPLARMSPRQLGYPLLVDADLPPNVGPLLTDEWHQESAPYNSYMPMEDSVHCVVGCVALALGEVMRYHRWPQKYDWDSMLDSYLGHYSEREGNAVAELLRDCGIAVNMKYGKNASSANTLSQPIALVDSFGYDRGIQMYYRDFFRHDEWHSLFRRELAAGRPILLCARSATTSHAFVCDGYNEDGMYHILWGNPTKEEDGWYNIDYLTPDQPQWHNYKDNPERGLNLVQSICVGVQPPTDSSKETYSFGFSHISAQMSNEGHLTVVTYNLANIGRQDYEGQVALAIKHDGELIDILDEYRHDFKSVASSDTSYTDTFCLKLPKLDSGIYRIVPVYQENDLWTEIRTSVGTPNFSTVEVTGDGVAVRENTATSASLILRDLNFPDTIMHKMPTHFSISITNGGNDQYCGRFFLALTSPGDELVNKVFQQQGFYLDSGETINREFTNTPLEIGPGIYTLQIFTDIDLFTDSFINIGNYVERRVVVLPYVAPSEIRSVKSDRIECGQGNSHGKDVEVSSHVYITDDGRKVLRK